MIWEAGMVLGFTITLLLWDVWLALDKKKHNTISQIISRTSKRWWIIAYAWALMGGHWFLMSPLHPVPVWVVASSLIGASIGGILAGYREVGCPRWIAMVAGFFHGYMIWGQG